MLEIVMDIRKQKARLRFRNTSGRNKQNGVYALEFALVFPVFFLMFYAVLSFAMVFVAKQTLSLAAADGARAALRYFHTGQQNASAEAALAGRMEHACQVALQRASYLFHEARAPQCEVALSASCPADWACQVMTLTLRYSYRDQPLIPNLPGLHLLTPTLLADAASVTLPDPILLGAGGAG